MEEINSLVLSWNLTVDYKGETKDGKPHGWGKAYFQNGRMYEGEWQGGKQHGKAKEFYPDGTLQYEGDYKEGLRDGFGKVYLNDGSLKYEGEWKKGDKVDAPSTRTNWA
jgi:antitoxin component YwqK of YwqJK toxin-antitoxin module